MIIEGHLYSCQHGAYSIVVAAPSGADARAAFQRWLSERHGVNANPSGMRLPRSTRSLRDRPLIITTGAK